MTEGPAPEKQTVPSWRESAVEFVTARMELVALEAREAGRVAARRGALLAFIGGCAMTAWLAGMAGLIGGVAFYSGITWYWVALAASLLHLLLAGIAAMLLRRPTPPAFPIARSELLKDREWLLNLKDKPTR